MGSTYRGSIVPRRELPPTYAEVRGGQEFLELMLLLRSPDGLEFDLTPRWLDDFGEVEEAVEIDLLELAHGDADVSVDDRDGEVSRFLSGSKPGDQWTLEILRETGERRPKWETVFAGVLDLPWSYQLEEMDRIVRLRIFSYSKLLENASAESVRRTFGTLKATVSAGTQTVTLTTGTTSGIEPGDEIRLDDGEIREKQTVLQLNSSSVVVTEANWTNGFTAQTLTVETPYHRDRSIEFLVGELFRKAGIATYEIDIRNPLNGRPFPSPMARRGLKSGLFDYLLDRAGKIQVKRTGDTQIWSATSPSSGWITDGSGAQRYIDWRINLLSEPVNFVDHAGNSSFDGPADQVGALAADRHYYSLIYYPAVDELWLRRDGADFRRLESAFTIDAAGTGATLGALTDSEDRIWYSFKKDDGSKALKYHRIGPNDIVTVGSGAGTSEWFGQIQALLPVGLTVFKPHFGGDGSVSFQNAFEDQLHIYSHPMDASPPTLLGKVEVPRRLRVVSMRAMIHPKLGKLVAGIYYTPEATKMRVWRIDGPVSWIQVADFTLVGEDTNQAFGANDGNWITVFDHARTDPDDSEPVFLVSVRNPAAGGGKVPHLFVVSTQFIGVVPYADFSGMSVAAALRELALMTMSHVTVDSGREGRFSGRALDLLSKREEVQQLPAPLQRTRSQLWEFYRTSVEVRGEDASGSEVSAIAGDAGASARRESFSSKFVTSEALAAGIAHQYLGYLGKERSEELVTVPDAGRAVHALDRVELAGVEHLVINARRDLIRGEATLRLFAVEA